MALRKALYFATKRQLIDALGSGKKKEEKLVDPVLLTTAGISAEKHGDMQAAAMFLESAVQAGVRTWKVFRSLGRVYMKLAFVEGREERKVALCEKGHAALDACVKCAPLKAASDLDLLKDCILVMFGRAAYAEAAKILAHCIDISPSILDDPDMTMIAAQCMLRGGQKGRAAAQCKSLLDSPPKELDESDLALLVSLLMRTTDRHDSEAAMEYAFYRRKSRWTSRG